MEFAGVVSGGGKIFRWGSSPEGYFVRYPRCWGYPSGGSPWEALLEGTDYPNVSPRRVTFEGGGFVGGGG